jgi:DNA-binding response OmpR family regulator
MPASRSAPDDYLTKPFTPQELRVRVGAHLAKR